LPRRSEEAVERLRAVISLCKLTEFGDVDPFSVDVDYVLSVLRRFFPHLKSVEELCLDAEAVKELAKVLQRQDEWVKRHSTTLYRDPFLLERRLWKLDPRTLARAFLKAWRPILYLEGVSTPLLLRALGFWDEMGKVFIEFPERPVELPAEVEAAPVFEDFSAEVEELLEELRERSGGDWVDYWGFISSESFEETVKRAYITAFLVTCGYAVMEVDETEGRVRIRSVEKPVEAGRPKSIPISISVEDWRKSHAEGGVREEGA